MNPLEELERSSIPVTWATVAIGLDGPGAAPPQIGLTETRSWIEAALHRDRAPDGAIDVLLAIENDDEPKRLIAGLANHASSATYDELRKWQSVMLRRELAELPTDPFYAALALADFWQQFGDVDEGPGPTREELVTRLTGDDRERLVRRQGSWLAPAPRAPRGAGLRVPA